MAEVAGTDTAIAALPAIAQWQVTDRLGSSSRKYSTNYCRASWPRHDSILE